MPTTGEICWVKPTGPTRSGAFFPVAASGRLVFAVANDCTNTDHTFYLQAVDVTTGKEQWRGPFAGAGQPQPQAPDLYGTGSGVIVTVKDDYTLVGVDAGTGQVRWTGPPASVVGNTSDLAVVVLTPGTGGTVSAVRPGLTALDRRTGKQRWHTSAGVSRPIGANDHIIVVRSPLEDAITAYSTSDGHQVWQTPLVGADHIRMGGDVLAGVWGTPPSLHALDATTGMALWSSTDAFEDVAVADGQVYGVQQGQYKAFDARKGTLKWASRLPSGVVLLYGDVLAGSGLVLNESALIARDASTGAQRWQLHPNVPELTRLYPTKLITPGAVIIGAENCGWN
jgi:outer membrane protein assembly factor BamB